MSTGSGLVTADRVVTSTEVFAPGWVSYVDGLVAGIGQGQPPAALVAQVPAERARPLGDATVIPGFVDVHVHGGGGASYTDATAERVRVARATHLAHGTTSNNASLVADAPERLLESVRLLAGLVTSGDLRGIHLEGPWLSPLRAGAHDPELLRAPSLDEIDALLRAGTTSEASERNAISMVTIAPELPGAIDAIEHFRQAGVTVAIGHTDAEYAAVMRAIDAGATVATHLYNAMRPLHHREPGPVLALLQDERVMVELIADGTHVHSELARWTADQVGAERAMLITDAMGAAACGDGSYRLGGLDVEVSEGVARLAHSDTIAGSTATMDELFRSWVLGASGDTSGPQFDARLTEAVRLTATSPARALGWADVGDLTLGMRADMVVIDPGLRVTEVLLGGLPAA